MKKMSMGYKILDGKAHCLSCDKAVSVNEKVVINYCPHCGAPLNIGSASKQESKEIKSKLALLYEMQDNLGASESAQDLLTRYIEDFEEDTQL